MNSKNDKIAAIRSCPMIDANEKTCKYELHAFWYGRQDLNLQGFPSDSKSDASANSATSVK